MTNNPNQPETKNQLLTIISYAVVLVLFGLCIFLLIGNRSCTAPGNATAATSGDSTITINQKDTIKSEAGKSTIISTVNNSTTKYAANAAPAADDITKRADTLYKYFILVFGVFIILIILPRLKNFNISATGITADFNEIAKAINETQQGQAVQHTDEQNPLVKQKLLFKNTERVPVTAGNNDPQKGKWGGSNMANERRLTADITQITGSEWADITLRVESTNPSNPLTGIVYFHLHPTFTNPDRIIIAINGTAELKIKAWGAFTVGAECDDNKRTKLELDLENSPGAFSPFKDR